MDYRFYHYTTGVLRLPASGGPVHVPTELRYSDADCLAVHMTFHVPGNPAVTWVFGWELLGEGTIHPAGEGDVRVAPAVDAPRDVELLLRAPEGEVRVRYSARDLRDFVGRVRVMSARSLTRMSQDADRELLDILEGA
ncbi:SsgA family sporulation/cell division regulator [Streptomyces sp. PTM05]|uniref:SsgA family sporulation/cell division regulator n=1 Tax=Streptantibioticus parmotrematis TaxID=2873249 RepID=A0ABS7QL93_9ACTN|nr:SsgA family sporulation/cell division regulator [Streptantibioticus parmotrematis]MBY8883444.1 SsgA family sporulation/cell division regulator [Streptantibioticus parmotrematis]